jgi:thioesterase domain-containing protein
VNLEAMFKYAPREYRGRVVFFRASERDAFTVEHPEAGWLELVTGQIDLHEVPGNHITMNFPPNVEVMAEHLKGHLKAVQERG